MDQTPNICAGPFGMLYDVYIERPWFMRAVSRVTWGVNTSVMYTSMEAIGLMPQGATILDVPCGGGVSFRALRPEQDVRYIAADLSEKMLERAKARAKRRSLHQIEFVKADMTALPFEDGEVDLIVCLNGLHMLKNAEPAVEEFARCLKPGGRMVGTTFLADGTRRGNKFFEYGSRGGHPIPPSRESLQRWFAVDGLAEATVGSQPGYAEFSAHKPALSGS